MYFAIDSIFKQPRHALETRQGIGKLKIQAKYTYYLLKEYYEIVDEARPLSGFFYTHADFFYRNAFLIMKLSKLRALIVSQSTFQ